MYDNTFFLLPQICEIKPLPKFIKMTILENISSGNKRKNHYRKLYYAKIYLLKDIQLYGKSSL